MDSVFENSDQNDFETVHSYEMVSTLSSDFGLNSPNVQKFIHSTDLHFDLVIKEDFFHESWLMFAYKFDAPVITICKFSNVQNSNYLRSQTKTKFDYHLPGTYGYADFFDRAMGLLTPWSHVPHQLLDYDDSMSYSERVYNLVLSAYDAWLRHWVALPKQNQIAQRYFSHLISKLSECK